MKTFVFRLARRDGKQHLGELLNVTIKGRTYTDAQLKILDKYTEYFIVGYTENK